MRKILSLFLLTGMTGVAEAHTLAHGDGLVMQFVHQFLGLHHLPITALIIVGGIAAIGIWYRKST